MNRITEAERIRFHKILDDSIDKLNSPKNTGKRHWSEIEIYELAALQNNECRELIGAVITQKGQNDIESECFDNINFPLFIIDNLRGNK